jgi:hypothetical protein
VVAPSSHPLAPLLAALVRRWPVQADTPRRFVITRLSGRARPRPPVAALGQLASVIACASQAAGFPS